MWKILKGSRLICEIIHFTEDTKNLNFNRSSKSIFLHKCSYCWFVCIWNAMFVFELKHCVIYINSSVRRTFSACDIIFHIFTLFYISTKIMLKPCNMCNMLEAERQWPNVKSKNSQYFTTVIFVFFPLGYVIMRCISIKLKSFSNSWNIFWKDTLNTIYLQMKNVIVKYTSWTVLTSNNWIPK